MTKYCEITGDEIGEEEIEEPKDVLTKKHDKETQLEREVYKIAEKVRTKKEYLNWKQWFRLDQAVDELITAVQLRMMRENGKLSHQDEIDNPNYYK
jgi:ferritin